ncbi:hypothetical protein BDQ17DRAFT_1419724 [Cyathus striatus]|nr:hypothetical protein BDQ17DRAFT_1419724 [Cyathus striatus]
MTKVKEDAVGSYLAHFRTHVAEIQDTLNGRQGTPLPPSFVSPTSFWTALEKDAFFHSLSLHSRLRPDLIAASIRSKTTLDVCAYIDLLEQASLHDPIPSSSLFMEMDAAREVSDSWIAWEEENASTLISVEPIWERKTKQGARDRGQANDSQSFHSDDANNASEDREISIQSLRPIQLAVLETMLKVDEEDLSHSQQMNTSISASKHGSCTSAQVIFVENDACLPFNKRKSLTDEESHIGLERYLSQANKMTVEGENFASLKNEKTRRSRIRRKFSTAGIDVNFLNDTGLGLFRLDVLGRLMKCEGDGGTSISADTIRLLRVVVSEFICRVIHHVVISREQEQKAKADTKAWGHLKLMGAAQVKAALQSMNLHTVNKDLEIISKNLSNLHDTEEFMDMRSQGMVANTTNQSDTEFQSIYSEMCFRRKWPTPYINLRTLPEDSSLFHGHASSVSRNVKEEDPSFQFDTKQEETLHDNMDKEDMTRDITYEDYLWSTTLHRLRTSRTKD